MTKIIIPKGTKVLIETESTKPPLSVILNKDTVVWVDGALKGPSKPTEAPEAETTDQLIKNVLSSLIDDTLAKLRDL